MISNMKKSTMLGLATLILSFTANAQLNYAPAVKFNPPTYVCYKTSATITVDGKLSPEEWDAIPLASALVDIEGSKRPNPFLNTELKMAYNDEGMFFAVLMEEPHVWATITEHDAVIFHDNDFEIFLNPTNDTHNYLEYEVNALGTVWDLYLSKPYRDGGTILNGWEFAGMQSAVHVDGTLNDPTDIDKSWSLEVFIPWASINQVKRKTTAPNSGEQMRVNFSRVQWTAEVQDGKYVKVPIAGEDRIREYNWVWAPTGVIDIHRPEFWGFVQFSDKEIGQDKFVMNPDEQIKWELRNLYYRQREYHRANGNYANNIADLKANEVCSNPEKLQLHSTPSLYEIIMPTTNGRKWHIRQDGLVWSTE